MTHRTAMTGLTRFVLFPRWPRRRSSRLRRRLTWILILQRFPHGARCPRPSVTLATRAQGVVIRNSMSMPLGLTRLPVTILMAHGYACAEPASRDRRDSTPRCLHHIETTPERADTRGRAQTAAIAVRRAVLTEALPSTVVSNQAATGTTVTIAVTGPRSHLRYPRGPSIADGSAH